MKRLFLATTLILHPQVVFSLEQNQRVKPIPSRAIPDYQLGGSYEPPLGVTVVARDSTAMPAEGLYNICYVNGFQTSRTAIGQKSFWLLTKTAKHLPIPAGQMSIF
ncbi:endo alpha-1,4 polygalactosaminidase [Rhizobium sp. CG4]|uniref:endo alpha-1,4 polygalactosaminidase n=1 Tax=Rhizobium sp. CG4 TaxID=2726075 RepID=UPI0020343290|nr:endo alpha-1,4 polygalactosaminidase [Rhizobium sp. CG4]